MFARRSSCILGVACVAACLSLACSDSSGGTGEREFADVPGFAPAAPTPTPTDPATAPGQPTSPAPGDGMTGIAGQQAPPPLEPTPPTPTEPTPTEPTPTEPTPTEPEPTPIEPPIDEPEPPPANPGDPFDSLRQLCVDTINDYRASEGLAPLARGSVEQETCSDTGAEKDAVNNAPHSSAGDCAGLGGQNTCPSARVGGWGAATIEDAMLRCLESMWNEGPPPVPRAECIANYSGCFLVHGHYMNMADANYGTVACGFYEREPGVYWMNQNFGR